MEQDIILREAGMPQLRQMVLENTERINRNEMLLNEMIMEREEESRINRERDKSCKTFRCEMEESYRQSKERMDRLERFAEASRVTNEKEMAALRQRIAETMLSVKQLSSQLSGTTGHIVEGLLSSSAEKIFEDAGFELEYIGKNIKRRLKAEDVAMEVDVLLGNDSVAIPIEVKTNFTKENVDRFLHQMTLFRKLFTDCADKEVIAAVAAINYDKDVDQYAHEQGLLVIRVSSDDIFSIDPFDRAKLRRF